MELRQRLQTQWTESAQDWIDTDQAVRTGMLDRWMLDALGDVGGKSVIDIGLRRGQVQPPTVWLGRDRYGRRPHRTPDSKGALIGVARRNLHHRQRRKPYTA